MGQRVELKLKLRLVELRERGRWVAEAGRAVVLLKIGSECCLMQRWSQEAWGKIASTLDLDQPQESKRTNSIHKD